MSQQGPKGLGEDEAQRIVQERTMKRDTYPQMLPLTDSATVGMAGFALTMFLLSIINAGWLDQIGTFIPPAFFYGGLVQLLCGMWEFRNNRTFGAVVFTSYGAFWLAFGFLFYFVDGLGILADVGASVGWTLVGWTVFTFYVWIATIKLNRAVFIMFSAFMLTLLLLDIGFLIGVQELIVAAGYMGILLALCAWYISAASFLNSIFGRIVLPLGAPVRQAPLVGPEQPPELSRHEHAETQRQQDI